MMEISKLGRCSESGGSLALRRGKGILAFVACLFALLLLALAPAQKAYADEVPLPLNESFVLSVSQSDGSYLVEPLQVPYTEGQSIQEALEATDLQFVFDEGGWLESIKGVGDISSSYFYRFSDYDSHANPLLGSVGAQEISSLYISSYTKEGEIADSHCAALDSLGVYMSRSDGLRNYPAAIDAYSAAKTGLSNASATAAQTLASTLDSAIKAYDSIMNGPTYSISFVVKQNGSTVGNARIRLTDVYGNSTEAVSNSAKVVAGTYSYEVLSADGRHAVRGKNLVVSKAASINAELPSGSWFGDIKLKNTGDGKNDCAVLSGSVASGQISFAVPDRAQERTDIFVYAAASENLKALSTYKADYPAYAVYVGTDGVDHEEPLIYESGTVSPPYMVAPGIEGNEVSFEIRHTTDTGGNAYQVEICRASLERSPTLKALSASADSLEYISGFAGYTIEYPIVTASDTLDIKANAYGSYEAGYSVKVDGTSVAEGSAETINIPASAKTTPLTVPIEVSLANGTSKTYNLKITKKDLAQISLKHDSTVSVELFNAAGSKITPSSTTTTSTAFNLIAGQKYTYVGTKDSYYHVKNSFTATAGTSPVVATPPTTDWLSLMELSNNGNYNTVFEDTNSSLHEYDCRVLDTNLAVFFRVTTATPRADLTYKVNYSSQRDGSAIETTLGAFTNSSGKTGAQGSLAYLLRRSGYSNQAILTVSQDANPSEGTYYQDYHLNLSRILTLQSLSVLQDDNALVMTQTDTLEDKNPMRIFDYRVTDYTVIVREGTSSLDLRFFFQSPSDSKDLFGGGYRVRIGGEEYDYDPRDPEKMFTHTAALDPTLDTQNIEVVVSHVDAAVPDTTYTVRVEQAEAAEVNFEVDPPEASITLIEEFSGNQIAPHAQGAYSLSAGFEYSWTASCFGYVGASGKFTAEEGKQISASLPKAEDNPAIDPSIVAQWPYFRADENNNSVVANPTPNNPSNSVLYWAEKLGTGVDTGAAGSPILVDGYLYSYAGNKIYKLDTLTGKTVAQGIMTGTSSFAITPMTYAEGMVFVALANGTVQAFNADTLDSLWVYTSPLGGQPNCPITYFDGCVYTGFWNFTSKMNFVCLTITDELPSQPKEKKTPLWTYAHTGGFYWAGAYASADFVLVGSDYPDPKGGLQTSGDDNVCGSLFSFDPKTGKLLDKLSEYPGDVKIGHIRSTVVYDEDSDRYYYVGRNGYLCSLAMNPDGTFDRSSIKTLKLYNGNEDLTSTTTPIIYKGRAYVGAEAGTYGPYEGQCVNVVDLATNTIAYKVNMQGRPQATGLLSTAYVDTDGYYYVYFIDNYTPGKIRYFKDKPGQTEALTSTTETYTSGGSSKSYEVADVLFSPQMGQKQYCICSPIVDEYGTIYFKNDSGYMMALGSTIDSLEVTQLPDITEYVPGEKLDTSGMVVKTTYSNGVTRDIPGDVTRDSSGNVSDYKYFEPSLTALNDLGDFQVEFKFPYTMYQSNVEEQDVGNAPDYNYSCPTAFFEVSVSNTIAPTISTKSLDDASVGSTYEATLVARGAPTVFTWTLSAGELPEGFSLDAKTGKITGTPTVSEGGSYDFTVEVSNTTGSASQELTLVVNEKPTIITAYNGLPTASWNTPYEGRIEFCGYPGPLALQIYPGDRLPTGLSLDPTTGVISGISPRTGSTTVKIRAYNPETGASSAYKQFSLSVGVVEILAGNSAADTASVISMEAFTASQYAVLARDDDFADAMSASGLAGALDAPIILTNNKALSAAAKDELIRLGVSKVYVVGGPGAMAPAVVNSLEALNITTERVFGNQSWDTSIDCARLIEQITGEPAKEFIVATSSGFQDALSVSSYAYAYKVPILLQAQTGDKPLPTEAVDMIGLIGDTKIFVPGGPGAVKESTVEGLFGKDRVTRVYGSNGYDTSAEIAAYMVENKLLNVEYPVVASGATAFKGVDALAGAALAGKNKSVVLLVSGNPAFESYNTVSLDSFLADHTTSVKKVYALGGTSVMPKDLIQKIENMFTYEEIDLSGAVFSKIARQIHTGEPLRPEVEVSVGGEVLVEGVDYEISYANNTEVGTATLSITGIGRCFGTASTTFKIVSASEPEPAEWVQLFGASQYDTMAAIVAEGWDSADTVILSTGTNFPDALSAAGLAGVLGNAPIVLTDPTALSEKAKETIVRLNPSKVVIIGGVGALKQAVEDAVAAAVPGAELKRVFGTTSIDTACEMYKYGTGWGNTAIIARGDSFADALSIAPYAYANKFPIFQVASPKTGLDDTTLAVIKGGGFSKVIIVGGTGAVSASIEGQLADIATERWYGTSLYETSAAIAAKSGMQFDKMAVATGKGFPDALAGAALCGKNGSVLCLVDEGDAGSVSIGGLIAENKDSIREGYFLGGNSVVTPATQEKIKALWE